MMRISKTAMVLGGIAVIAAVGFASAAAAQVTSAMLARAVPCDDRGELDLCGARRDRHIDWFASDVVLRAEGAARAKETGPRSPRIPLRFVYRPLGRLGSGWQPESWRR